MESMLGHLEEEQELERHNYRRILLKGALSSPFVLLTTTLPIPSIAAVTDETDNFADNWWSTPAATTSKSSSASTATKREPTDEVTIQVPLADLKGTGLGLELGQVEFKSNVRVYVKSVLPGSLANRLGIKPDWIVVAVNGKSAERTDAAGVAILVSKATTQTPDGGRLTLRFRDTAVFTDKLNRMSAASGDEGTPTVTTEIAPPPAAADRSALRNQIDQQSSNTVIAAADPAGQRLTVQQLIPPRLCGRPAQMDDLMELSYVGTVVDTGDIFDGSSIRINGKGIQGRGNDVSVFFVLGKQPFGQFPPGWDVGLVGMCIGERRRLIVPPALAYGSEGLARRRIPPNATLQYDVTLVSLNGLATPQ